MGDIRQVFRPNRPCLEKILHLKLILRNHKIYDKIKPALKWISKNFDSWLWISFKILNEQSLDLKTLILITETLTQHKIDVKFMGEIWGLSPFLFNWVLEKYLEIVGGKCKPKARITWVNKTPPMVHSLFKIYCSIWCGLH